LRRGADDAAMALAAEKLRFTPTPVALANFGRFL